MQKPSSKKSGSKSAPKERKVEPVAEEVKTQTINYEFINKEISIHLKCPQCKQLMRNPLRLHPCAHTFCQPCAPSNGKCPKCNAKIRAIQKDLIGEGLVNELMVRCLNEGCPYKDTFEDYKKYHQGKCKLQVGLEQWLRGMKSTLKQHERRAKRPSDEEQNEQVQSDMTRKKQDHLQKEPSVVKKPSSNDADEAGEESMLSKYLRRQL